MFKLDVRRITVVAVFIIPVGVRAQNDAGRLDRVAALSSPILSSPAATSNSVATVTLSTDEKKAQARVALVSGLRSLAITTGGPIDKSSKQTTLADETGLGQSVQVGLAYSHIVFKVGDKVDPQAISAVCQRYRNKRDCTRQELSPAGQRAFDIVTNSSHR